MQKKCFQWKRRIAAWCECMRSHKNYTKCSTAKPKNHEDYRLTHSMISGVYHRIGSFTAVWILGRMCYVFSFWEPARLWMLSYTTGVSSAPSPELGVLLCQAAEDRKRFQLYPRLWTSLISIWQTKIRVQAILYGEKRRINIPWCFCSLFFVIQNRGNTLSRMLKVFFSWFRGWKAVWYENSSYFL